MPEIKMIKKYGCNCGKTPEVDEGVARKDYDNEEQFGRIISEVAKKIDDFENSTTTAADGSDRFKFLPNPSQLT